MDLRWLGNGSPHMYCFWKIREDVNVLQHHDISKARHAKGNLAVKFASAIIDKASDKVPSVKNIKNKKITIEKIMKKIAEKVSKKTINKLSFGNFLITGAAGVVSEKLADLVVDIFEKNNPAALEIASSYISNFEDVIMNVTDFVDDVPVARDLARGFFEFSKTINKANNYPVNVFKEVGKNLFNQDNYKKVKDPLDFADNIGRGTVSVIKGVGATVNTVQDIGYGVYDTLTKGFRFLF
ncbi:conserved hypothetical protein [Candidatus Phytoplasma mali]|uniref:Uncharacterized protein n=1 Tax=Phytoplasma mali (strain AT) TaxID=482235 RepID=B3R031_PHYMT|nr:hypothetical protein [Candidatus Phytoplasma mali]CAP18195.1 hypothetical protein ATP_00008 [Candidatus Phytoplasma mali]CAP18677.1 conserved hypothetical protein [Candidatus Phytoplasma mali]